MEHSRKSGSLGSIRLLGSWAQWEKEEAVRIKKNLKQMELFPIAPFCLERDKTRASRGASRVPGVSVWLLPVRRRAWRVGWGSCPECLLDPTPPRASSARLALALPRPVADKLCLPCGLFKSLWLPRASLWAHIGSMHAPGIGCPHSQRSEVMLLDSTLPSHG